MSSSPRQIVEVPEHTRTTVSDAFLSSSDYKTIEELGTRHVSVRQIGNAVEIDNGPCVGVVNLDAFQLRLVPKIEIAGFMRLVSYAFGLEEFRLLDGKAAASQTAEQGLVDLLCLALLHAVERLARGGLLPSYEERLAPLSSPRGRIMFRQTGSCRSKKQIFCRFEHLTVDNLFNRTLKAGLQFARRLARSATLRGRLSVASQQLLPDVSPCELRSDLLHDARVQLDRRSKHYETALNLIALLFEGGSGSITSARGTLPGFLLDMNVVFERFVGRLLRSSCPANCRVSTQVSNTSAFRLRANPLGWDTPTLKADYVVHRGTKIHTVADAKYMDLSEKSLPSSALYQLVAYALGYEISGSQRRTVVLYPTLDANKKAKTSTVRLVSSAVEIPVEVHAVGVPLPRLLAQEKLEWWPTVFQSEEG